MAAAAPYWVYNLIPLSSPLPTTPGSASFDSLSSLELSPGFSVAPGTGFSFAFWLKVTPGHTRNNIITQTSNPSDPLKNMWWFGTWLFDIVRFVTYASDSTSESPGGFGVEGLDGTWVNVVCVYDDTVLNAPFVQCYHNNLASGISAAQDMPMHDNAGQCNLLVGNGVGDGFPGTPGPGGLIGFIDSLFFWNKALSAAEVNTLWNGGAGMDFADLSGSLLTSLLAAYNLDGPFASGPDMGLWPDYSGNGNHLTVNGVVPVGPPRNT